MFVQSLRTGLIATLFTALLVNVASAQKDSCDVCGEEVICKKVCCLKCEFTEVKFTCYKSEFEDICVPCRSDRCGDRCVSACTCKDGADGCGQKKIFGIWQPSGAEVKTRRRLMYKEVTKKIPTFRWELITRCQECCEGCRPATETLPAGVPAVPACAELMDIKQAQLQLDREQSVSQPRQRAETQTAVREAVAKVAPAENVRVARSIEAPTAPKATAPKATAIKATAIKATATNAIVTKAMAIKPARSNATAVRAGATKTAAANDNSVITVAKPIIR